ncbi:Ribosomal RNA small subunit methyltransferase E [Porphyridium purpureum]|uniref:16S rRNA (uracil(1498)-N(3))-methyltransferase n=1 Tax=Porphyridium purpureum TaxID=35688 RepID=A0A5J4Z5R4_PORPP|nr:Ribosomal RNA small subunit methyltransferase E [Porphyridium purpureum]|eukprot:POR0925..scf295_1
MINTVRGGHLCRSSRHGATIAFLAAWFPHSHASKRAALAVLPVHQLQRSFSFACVAGARKRSALSNTPPACASRHWRRLERRDRQHPQRRWCVSSEAGTEIQDDESSAGVPEGRAYRYKQPGEDNTEEDDAPKELLLVQNQRFSPGVIVKLSVEQLRHLRARRRLPGELIEVFDGEGSFATGVLQDGFSQSKTKGGAEVRLQTCRSVPPFSPRIVAAVAIPKGSRHDWMIEKLTELGVDEIVPIVSAHSQRSRVEVRAQRWKRLIVASSQQCLRPFLPTLGDELDLDELVDYLRGLPSPALTFLAAADGSSFHSLWSDALEVHSDKELHTLVFVVGPEGGFSESEEALLVLRGGAKKVGLGRLRLRTETASIALASCVASLFV